MDVSTLPNASLGAFTGAGGGAGANAAALDFTVQPQAQDQWCWAAVSSSVSRFYLAGSPWTQCQVAAAELQFACCGADASGPCDRWWYLNRALERTQNLTDFVTGQLDAATILQQLQNGAPVGVRVEWTDGSGHFIAISGIDLDAAPEPTLTVTDPIYGEHVIPVSTLSGAYQQSGRWTHSYTTQP
jgi:hypothetical protein